MSERSTHPQNVKQVPYGVFLLLFVISCAWHADRTFGTGELSFTKPTLATFIGALIGLLFGLLMWFDNKSLLRKITHRDATLEDAETSPELFARPFSKEIIAIAMILFPMIAGILIWEKEALQLSRQDIQILGSSCIIATALMAYLDMRSLIQTSTFRPKTTVSLSPPIATLFGIIVIWMLCFPLHFMIRRWHGGRNWIVGGLIATVVFMTPTLRGFIGEPILPAVDSPEILALIVKSFEESHEYQKQKDLIGPITVRQSKEITYDEKNQRRTGSLKVVTKMSEEQLFFVITWNDRAKGQYQINFFKEQP